MQTKRRRGYGDRPGSIALMSLRGVLAAFGSDEKHLVLILDKLCPEYVDDHHQKGAMKLPLLKPVQYVWARGQPRMEIKMEMPLQCLKRYVQEYDLSGTFDW